MKIATCVNNHIYDSDIYSSCPYCDPVKADIGPAPGSDPGSVPASGQVPGQTTGLQQEKVVGWLACIDGPSAGTSYTLYDKQNRVGRDRSLDICIAGDPTISEKHALIAYDPRHNRFTLVPKTETNLMSLNGVHVSRAVKLADFDRIEMGKSRFIFVALCGERFNWKKAESGQEPEQQAKTDQQ